MAIVIRTPKEIGKMRRSGAALRGVLQVLRDSMTPGMTTMDLEKIAEAGIAKPARCQRSRGIADILACCAPRSTKKWSMAYLLQSDLAGGRYGLGGLRADHRRLLRRFGDRRCRWEKIAASAKKLLDTTERSLEAAIEVVRPGATLGDVGAAVQEVVEEAGFSVVREFVGHGIGTEMHEEPQDPEFRPAAQGIKLREGMVLAIEPMVNAGRRKVRVLQDGWTAVTVDGSLSAHFEHTVAVVAEGAEVLTA